MATSLPHLSRRQSSGRPTLLWAAVCLSALVALPTPPLASAQSAAEWSQIKAKCGLPAGTIYNTWVGQGAPCNQGSSGSAAANGQQQLATQATMAGAMMIGEGLHDALFGKPETQEHLQLRMAAKQLNNSGVWYMHQHDYANALVEFQKALQKTPNDATILGNLTLAQRLLAQSSLNSTAAVQNSNVLGNVLGVVPPSSRPSSWDQPENLFHNIDVNFTSNTVNLQNARTSSVDPAVLRKNDPASGHPLQTKQDWNDAFDKAVGMDANALGQRQQLNSEFDKFLAPADSSTIPPQPQPTKTKPHPAASDSQKPAEKP